MGKRTDECGHKPILEALEPRLLLDGMTAEQAIELFHTTPAVFIENQGQWESSVRFVHKGQGANIAHTDSGPVFELFREVAGDEDGVEVPDGPNDMLNDRLDAEPAEMERLRFSAGFDGANTVTPVGIGEAETRFNFLLGEEDQWCQDVPSYEIVAYEGLYDGIDLHTWGQRDSLKYEFHVAPGADYSAIQVRYDGVEGLSLTEDGSLAVDLGGGWGQLVDDAPYIYQIVDGTEAAVSGRFVLLDEWTCSFEIEGDYDPAGELIIDPDLSWATYLGGSGSEMGVGIAVDASGSAFVTGRTRSSPDFSGANNAYGGYNNDDAFVAKVTSGGSLVWATYLGGSSGDVGRGIAVDASGGAFVTGYTGSTNFAGVNNTHKGSGDAFVAKVTGGGSLSWATYLGGSRGDSGVGIAVDASGSAFVTGRTSSTNFAGANNAYKGNYDAFVAKVTSGGSLSWATYLGGSSNDFGEGIAVDASGGAFVTGPTYSTDFAGANNTYKGGSEDAFAAKVTSGGALVWATYLGGSGNDYGNGIAVDASGGAFVLGDTWSTNFSGANNAYKGGSWDAFVAKVTSGGSLVWATYLGGSGDESGVGIAVDASGSAFVTGRTSSTDFFGANNTFKGVHDAFVAKISGAGMGSMAHADFEFLAREIAYQSWSETTPVGVKDFVVDREFVGPYGFYALGLTSESDTYDPILLIRGTDGPTNIPDMLSNSDPYGVGYNQFINNWGSVAGWLLEQEGAGHRVDIVGHSLGGALAQWIAAEFTSNDHYIGEVVTFNSPGISDSESEYPGLLTYAHEFDPSKAQGVTHYIVNGDLVSMAGEAFISGQYVMASFSDWTWIDFDKHLRPILVDEAGGRTRPGDLQLQPSAPVADLNDPNFDYDDSDYRHWQTGMQVALFAAEPMPPSILFAPAAMNNRHTAEAKRRDIGEAIELIGEAVQLVKAAGDRVVLTLQEGRRRLHDLYELTAITFNDAFSLGVDAGDPPALVFDGGLSVAMGNDISIDLPGWLGGTFTADHLIDLMALDTSGHIDRQGMSFSGDVELLGGLLTMDTDAMMDWRTGEAAYAGALDILNGFVTAGGSLTVGSQLDIALAGAAAVSIPDGVPFIGGATIASGNFAVEFSNDLDLSNDFVAGWGSVLGIDLGLRVWLDGGWQIMGAKAIEELQQASAPGPMQAIESSAATETHSYTVDPGASWVLFSMEWENAAPSTAITLETPGGVVLTEADITADPDMSILGDLTTDYRKVVRVDLPAAGTWSPGVVDTTGLGQVEFHALVNATIPVVSITALSGGGLQPVQIDFEAYDADSDAAVSLFYDDDDAGFDGVMIATGIAEPDGPDSYVWDTASVAGGDYYVYAMIIDGENPPVFEYSIETIAITDPAVPFDRLVFYNNSTLDGDDPLPNVSDDAAIAADKRASLDLEAVSSTSVTSYAKGINGVMVDIVGLVDPGGLSATDFAFRVCGPEHPDLWTAGPAPVSVTPRLGDGRDGSDRVTIIWGDGAIKNQWLEVTVLATARTGLGEDDVFYFGNVIGDTDGDLVVDSGDYGTLMGQFGLCGNSLAADLNGDQWVDLADFAIMRGAYGNSVSIPSFPAAAPGPVVESGLGVLAVAVAATLVNPGTASDPAGGGPSAVIPSTALPSSLLREIRASSDQLTPVDLLMPFPSPAGYISETQAISGGSSATTLQLAATAEYDLRPLGDDPATDYPGDDLLADILAESVLALPL